MLSLLQRFAALLYLNQFGLLEFLLATFLIFIKNKFGFLPGSFAMLFLMDVVALFRERKTTQRSYWPYTLLVLYVILHRLLGVFFIEDIPNYYLNLTGSTILFSLSVYIIFPKIDLEKLKGALNWVTLLAMGGLVYHVYLLAEGYSIKPLNLLPLPLQNPLLVENTLFRPTSFFSEPQALVSFLQVPLLFSLLDKKYWFSFLIVLAMLLSTSTTGIVVSFLMVFVYAISQRISLRNILALGCLLLVAAYMLYNSPYFASGVEKMQTQDYQTNERLQGNEIVALMDPSHYLLGVPYASVTQFLEKTAQMQSSFGPISEDYIFVSSFWLSILLYGMVGFFLFYLCYFHLMFHSRQLTPLLVALLVTSYTNSDFLSGFSMYFMICLLAFYYRPQNDITYEPEE